MASALEVSFRVTGTTPTELRAAADEVARGFADGAPYDVTLEEAHGNHDLEGSGMSAREADRPSTFSAYVRVKVRDGKAGTAPRDEDAPPTV